MSQNEIFNPVDSFGNQIWKPEPDPRSSARIFLQLVAIGNKADVISDEQMKFYVSELRRAIFDRSSVVDLDAKIPLPVSFEEYERFQREEEAKRRKVQDELAMLAPFPIDNAIINPIQEWINAQGGLDNVLNAIQKNGWADTSSWEKDGRKFMVADIKRLGKT